MSKKLSLLNNIYVYLLFIALFGIANYSTTHGMSLENSDSKNKPTASNKDTSNQDTSATEIDPAGNPIIISSNEPVEKEFDQIRKYQSYDPATDTWSEIEDFKTVKILEDTTQLPPAHYLYYSFWAYDAQHKRWKRVDISDYGYKYGMHQVTPKSETSKEPEPDASTDEKKSSNFWGNLGLTFSVGGGGTYYNNDLKNLRIFVKKGNKAFYVQVPNSSDEEQHKAHLIRWFYKGNQKTSEIENLLEGVHDKHSLDSIPAGKNGFEGFGFNIPIMMGLHYTFFKKLRVGAGGNFEVNYLKELKPTGAASVLIPYELPDHWFYNIKWFGTIGYKIFQRPKDAIILDTQLGIVFDLGDSPIKNLFDFVHGGLYGSIGIAHERKINDYFKFFYRLSGDFKQYIDSKDFKSPKGSGSITILQPALHLEIGTTLHFGREIEEEIEQEEANEDTSANKDQNSSLDQVGTAVQSSEDELNKAADAKNRFKTDKNKLKGLFR
ncbi:MAG: hypothetical protein BGO68_00625 [Candidatus Amoebophilus sp. 36-38]|nr:MAG: hypothetical protein BGO68_00625 [Candidatus Amoebophilus sp. 36-38]